MPEPASFLFDSFALLVYLQDEPGASRIEKLLEDAGKEKCRVFMSLINMGELLYITERRGGIVKAQDALALIRQLPIEIVPVEEQLVFAAAHIKANYPLSYADAFVVAVAMEKSASIITGDPEFQSVEALITIEWLELADL
jgi:predicted nucleic acid-binding protein